MNYKGHSNCTIMFAHGFGLNEFNDNLNTLEKTLDENDYIVEDIKFSTHHVSNYTAMFIVRMENKK